MNVKMIQVELYRSIVNPIKLVVVALLAGILAAAGILWLPAFRWLCIIIIVGAVLILIKALVDLFDSRPRIIISEAGISYDKRDRDTVGWHRIQQAYIARNRKKEFVCLDVAIPETTSNHRDLQTQRINIPLHQLNADAGKLAVFINRMRVADENDRRSLLLTSGIDLR